MNINKAVLAGRISSDIETKKTQTGTSITLFSLCTNHIYKTDSGEKVSTPTFHNIVVFGSRGEAIKNYCQKGDRLYLEGKIENRKYEKKDGGTGYISEIILSDFQFIEQRGKDAPKSQPSRAIDVVEDGSSFDDLPFN